VSADSDPGVAPPASATSRPWTKWLLVASLALNLLIIGGAIGHHFMGHWGWHGGGRADQLGILGYARTLEPERRRAFRKLVQAERPNMKVLNDEIRKARVEASEALAAEPFDKDKARAALARIGEAEARLKSAGLGVVMSVAEQMTPAERAGFVDWWKRRRPHHFRLPRDHDGDGPAPPP
jgi:uncharacterized membrane protein